MLVHVKELLEQNAAKLKEHWPNAPLGIYSASLKKKHLGEPITFAGIQSIVNKSHLLGHIDLCIIDEAHCVSHKDEGGYRRLVKELLEINPEMRVIGLTASPFRLGHGYITDKPAIFDDLIEPVGIEELMALKYLAILRSKVTNFKLDTSGVKKRGGEFIESELQAAVDVHTSNKSVAQEIYDRAEGRKAWLIFCAGISHAHHIAEELRKLGVSAATVTGDMPMNERDEIINDFKSGKIMALTNAQVLTTGFDYPDIDLIAMLRPTMSPGLYMQMAGRGMRPKSHTDHCLVLDFAGVVETHGPITCVRPPNKAGEGTGEAPVKVCANCGELCHLAAKVCPACGTAFPPSEPPKLKLRDDDIMGVTSKRLDVQTWSWRTHVSRSSGKEMLACTYYGELSDAPVREYFVVKHEGYAGSRALQEVAKIAYKAGVSPKYQDLDEICLELNKGNPPVNVRFVNDGKFYKVTRRLWTDDLLSLNS